MQKLFDQYYNYFNPKATKAKVVKKSFKNMTLRDFEQLATKDNILKFDMDTKLSKHLNRMLVHRKDDPFFSHRYQVYLRKKLGTAMNVLLDHTARGGSLTPFGKLLAPISEESKTHGERLIDEKIEALRIEVSDLTANHNGGGGGGGHHNSSSL